MHLEQFEKLRELVDELTIKFRQLKYKNIELQRENDDLKNKIRMYENLPDDLDLNSLESTKSENERLNKKNREVKKHILELISQLENKKIGVDS